MRWLVFTSSNDDISKKCFEILQLAGQRIIHQLISERTSLKLIGDQILREKPERILVIVNANHRSKLSENIEAHILLPLFVAQATSQLLSRTPVLILSSFKDDPDTELLQKATDQLISIHPSIANVKLINPITDDDIKIDHFKTAWQKNPEERHHLTIISDILPILLALTHDGQFNEQLVVCNKGTVSLKLIEQLKNHHPQINLNHVDTEDFGDVFEECSQHKITPETRQLYQIPFVIPNVSNTIQQFFKNQSINKDTDAPKIILITGGCGFIGSTFINYWLKTYPRDKIVNIDRLDSVSNVKNIEQSDSSNYSLIVADISNKDTVLHLMSQYNITHIIHFAVQAHIDNSFGNSITFTESNVYGTHSVLEASRIYGKIQKFIHISTDEVYGETPTGSQQEICLLNPLNPYAATIAAAEFLVKSYGESFKLPFAIIRLCNVYGPRQHIEKVIPKFIEQISRGKKIFIEGDGKQIRHYLYVDDVVQAIELIFIKGKTKFVYNVSTEKAISVLEIAKLIHEKLRPDTSVEDMFSYGKSRSFKEERYHVDTANGPIQALGWTEKIDFDEGLDRTIEWFTSHPNYWTNIE